MKASYQNYHIYKKARRKFAFQSYLLLCVWLLLGIIQWCVVCLTDPIREVFYDHYQVCIITFAVALLLFYLYVYYEKLRFNNGLNYLISVLIIELQIISLFALVARVYWPDLIFFFALCVLLLFMAIFISSILPRRIDLTIDVALLFICAFFSILGAIFFLMCRFVITQKHSGTKTFFIFESLISLMFLMFVMYHAQTINGSRFAEMRLNDFLLASLILFHDFLIIYWLTFYWQFHNKPLTPDNILRQTTDRTTTTVNEEKTHAEGSEDDVTVTDDYYDATDESLYENSEENTVTSDVYSNADSSTEAEMSSDDEYFYSSETSSATTDDYVDYSYDASSDDASVEESSEVAITNNSSATDTISFPETGNDTNNVSAETDDSGATFTGTFPATAISSDDGSIETNFTTIDSDAAISESFATTTMPSDYDQVSVATKVDSETATTESIDSTAISSGDDVS
ncbi:uncharacterized protein LOC133841634 isoform X1 [Drosophila sulfurigaster albostrigata]|uniref:uncharacterized protein LOC133841634 isoform X1 n=1 Tax=Drosophila sulfurigaster albostrigata TaxID=89887 RepID=UPI002D21D09E|nr:uncharacterized protein LOC133841634 isoform X1 [Drosophila sulfurigaster albostrigata]